MRPLAGGQVELLAVAYVSLHVEIRSLISGTVLDDEPHTSVPISCCSCKRHVRLKYLAKRRLLLGSQPFRVAHQEERPAREGFVRDFTFAEHRHARLTIRTRHSSQGTPHRTHPPGDR